MSALDTALRALHARTEATRALLEALVRVNSHTANVSGVNAVVALLMNALAELPLTLDVESAPSGAEHVTFATSAAGPAVLLIGHHDTVFPPGMFEGYTTEGDLARGPGVLDMKGGLAIVVQALHALHAAELLARLPLRFVSIADEEIGSPSGRAVLEALAPAASCALVFEAGRQGDAVITSRRGSGHARVTAHGKAAHAGNALAEGRNAIWALARFVDVVSTQQASIVGSSASVGLIRGGSARNTVPDSASAELDLRFGDLAGQRALVDLLDRAAVEAEAAVPGARIEIAVQVSRAPWESTEASRALALRYAAAARAAGLSFAEAPRIGGGSDANTVGALGLPVIDGLGPRGRYFHTQDEQIELSSLPKKAEALLRLLVDLATS